VFSLSFDFHDTHKYGDEFLSHIVRVTGDETLIWLENVETKDHAFLLHPVCVNVVGFYNVRLTQHTFLIIYFYFQTSTCFDLFVRPSSSKSDTISQN
jgi:hypothetical protein